MVIGLLHKTLYTSEFKTKPSQHLMLYTGKACTLKPCFEREREKREWKERERDPVCISICIFTFSYSLFSVVER